MDAKKFLSLVIIVSLAQLAGCAPRYKIAYTSNKKDLRETEIKLAAAADSVSQSLKELAQIDKAIHPHAKMPSPAEPDMIGMGQLGSIDWSGPIAPLVKKIAEATDYKVHILGSSPAIPIIVSITATDTPLADILRDAEFQCGSKANIVVYPANKVIELRYTRI